MRGPGLRLNLRGMEGAAGEEESGETGQVGMDASSEGDELMGRRHGRGSRDGIVFCSDAALPWEGGRDWQSCSVKRMWLMTWRGVLQEESAYSSEVAAFLACGERR